MISKPHPTLRDETPATSRRLAGARHWTQVSGGEVLIVNPNLIHPGIWLSDPGTYEFEITATTNTSPPFVKKARATVILAAP
jgi:hypothetical protein